MLVIVLRTQVVEFGRISHQEKFGSRFFNFLMQEINAESWKSYLQIQPFHQVVWLLNESRLQGLVLK